jgi:hypothetical protein
VKALILFVLLCSSSWATVQEHTIQDKKIRINILSAWEPVKDLYGLPLVVLGPWENKSRPAITWVFTGMNAKHMTPEEFRKLFVTFKKEKEDWLKGHSGRLLKFEEATPIQFSPKLKGHFIGAEFMVSDVHFIERSYYLYCKDEVYNVKWSIRDEHRKFMKDLTSIVGSLECL